jgi:hypothetical protein
MATFSERWTPLIGPEAAKLQRKTTLTLGWSSLGIVVSLLLLAGFGITHVQGFRWAFLILLVPSCLVFVYGLLLHHLTHRAMSEFLGVHVWMFNSPNLRPEAFQNWCDRNGVSVTD